MKNFKWNCDYCGRLKLSPHNNIELTYNNNKKPESLYCEQCKRIYCLNHEFEWIYLYNQRINKNM